MDQLAELVGRIEGGQSFLGAHWGRAIVTGDRIEYGVERGGVPVGRIAYDDIPWQLGRLERVGIDDRGITEILVGFPEGRVRYVLDVAVKGDRRRLHDGPVRSVPVLVRSSDARVTTDLVLGLIKQGARLDRTPSA